MRTLHVLRWGQGRLSEVRESAMTALVRREVSVAQLREKTPHLELFSGAWFDLPCDGIDEGFEFRLVVLPRLRPIKLLVGKL